MTAYRIVQKAPEPFGLVVSNVAAENLAAWCSVRGMRIVGVNQNSRHRAELQGQPIISGLCGPMWDGDAVRYEDETANDILSR